MIKDASTHWSHASWNTLWVVQFSNQELDWTMIWSQNLEREPSKGWESTWGNGEMVQLQLLKFSYIWRHKKVLGQDSNNLQSQKLTRISSQHPCGGGGIIDSLCSYEQFDSYLSDLTFFTLPMKTQTPEGCGTHSLYPRTEIGFKPKPV